MIGWLRKRDHIRNDDLSAFLDGALRPTDVAAVASHLRRCPACSAALEEMQSVKSMLGGLPRTQPPRSFVVSARAAAMADQARPRPAPRALTFAPAVALTVLIALLTVDFALQPQGAAPDGVASLGAESAQKAAAGADAQSDLAAPPAAVQPSPVAAARQAQPTRAPAEPGAPTTTAPSAAAAEARPPASPNPTSVPPGGLSRDSERPASGAARDDEAQQSMESASGSDLTLLRLLEAAAAAGLALSLVLLYRTRSANRRLR